MACEKASTRVLKCSLWIILPILAASIVILVLFPTIYDTVLVKELALDRGTIATDIWEDIPLPIYENLYFFNITNVDAFLNGSETLSVTEVGPYCYKSRWVKDIRWNSADTVSYKETRTYHFDPILSNGTEDDQIYTLNGPMIIAASLSANFDLKLRTLLTTLLGIAGENIIIKRSIKQLVYEGYDDVIIKFAPILKPDLPFKNGKFSWLYGKNDTDDGLFTVYTGRNDQSKRNFIKEWNGEEKLSYWKGDTCNKLNGTNIEYGPPIQDDQDQYTFFQTIFCRSISLNYTGETSHFDIPAKRFRPTFSTFANSTENPDNYCFEIKKEQASGVLDVSPCQFDAPIYFSYPHFYMADPSYLKAVDGLNPNDKDHGSHLDVEPLTGFTINGAIKFQINVEISTIEGVLQTYNITNGIFPVLWVELSIQIDEHFANFLKSKTLNPKIISYSVLGILTGVSLILAVVFIVILCLRKEDDTDDPLLDATDNKYTRIENHRKHSKETANGNNWKEKLTKVDEDDESDEESSNYLQKTDSETSRLLK